MFCFIFCFRFFNFPFQRNAFYDSFAGNWIANVTNSRSYVFSQTQDQLSFSYSINITHDIAKNQKCLKSLNENRFFDIKVSNVTTIHFMHFNLYFDPLNSIHLGFYNSKNKCIADNETLITLPTQTKFPYSTSGNFFDQYVYHLLIRSKSRISITLFEKNISNLQKEFTGNIYRIDLFKDILQNKSKLIQLLPLIILTLIYIVGYIYRFVKQTKSLKLAKQTSKKGMRKSQNSNSEMESKDKAAVLKKQS